MFLSTKVVKPRVLVGTLALTLLSGCGDYQIDLPNGYRLVRTNASSIQIFSPPTVKRLGDHTGIVVPPKIVAIACVGDVVCGIVESSPDSENAALTVPGYFVLDTRTGDVTLGLNKEKQLEQLKKLGVTETPSLTRNIRSFRCGKAATGKSVAEPSSSDEKDSQK